jgi:hypothetical protein
MILGSGGAALLEEIYQVKIDLKELAINVVPRETSSVGWVQGTGAGRATFVVRNVGSYTFGL